MSPTLLIGDQILVDKTYSGKDTRRGDVIVFIYPADPRKDFVKRIIGLPGDKVELRERLLYINNELIKEDYIAKPKRSSTTTNYGPITVPEETLFVLGDNRENSLDSRHFGSVTFDKVRGRVTRID